MGFADFVAEWQMFLATYAGMSIRKKNLSDTLTPPYMLGAQVV
jgi:hypothetical protein